MGLIHQTLTLIAFSSITYLLVLAVWILILAWQNHAPSHNWQLGLISLQIILGIQSTCVLLLWQTLPKSLETLAYVVVAQATIPSVWVYLQEDSPRQRSTHLALACFFTIAMVIRVLQTTQGNHL